jgi:hypothetical protein
VADGRNRTVVRLQSQVWRGYLKGVAFYLYRSRRISSKDSGGDTMRGRIRRDTPPATSWIEGSMMKAKIRSRRRRRRRRDSGLLMSCPGRSASVIDSTFGFTKSLAASKISRNRR